MKNYKELGFDSEYEMNLYHDVCCEMNYVIEFSSFQDLLNYLETNNIKNIKNQQTKSQCNTFIRKNNLLELLMEVEEQPLVNRYIELYKYHANFYSISSNVIKLNGILLTNAIKSKNDEQANFYKAEISRTLDIAEVHLRCLTYIVEQVYDKVPLDSYQFIKGIEYVQSEVFKDNGNFGLS